MARRFYRGGVFGANVLLSAIATPGGGVRLSLPIGTPMRISSPTVGVDVGNWQVYDAASGWIPITMASVTPETGLFITISFTKPASIPDGGAVIVRNTIGANYAFSAEL